MSKTIFSTIKEIQELAKNVNNEKYCIIISKRFYTKIRKKYFHINVDNPTAFYGFKLLIDENQNADWILIPIEFLPGYRKKEKVEDIFDKAFKELDTHIQVFDSYLFELFNKALELGKLYKNFYDNLSESTEYSFSWDADNIEEALKIIKQIKELEDE